MITFFLTGIIVITGCTKTEDDDTTLGNWVERSSFNGYARSDAIAFTIDGKAYMGTGYDGSDYLKDFWQYDPSLNAWIQKADFSGTARSAAVGFSVSGNGYIATGYDGINYLKDCWKYNPDSNTWEQVSDFGGSARYGATAFSVNNKGYITTGYSKRYLKDFWEYDPTTDSWTSKISMGGSKRMFATTFVINDIAYLVGGTNNGSTVDDFWAFDPSTETWTRKRDITDDDDDATYDDDYTTIARSNAVVFTVGDTAYLVTGETPSLTSDVWQYDPEKDLWKERNSFDGTTRVGAVGFSVNNRGFIATGGSVSGGSTVYDDLWEFQPYVEEDD